MVTSGAKKQASRAGAKKSKPRGASRVKDPPAKTAVVVDAAVQTRKKG